MPALLTPEPAQKAGFSFKYIMRMSVKGDLRALELSAASLTDTIKNKATSRALNKMADQVRTEVPRLVKEEGYGLKIGRIKKDITILRASPTQLKAIIRARGRAIPMIEFGARQTKSGVSVNVKRQRKVGKGWFIAVMPTGHKGVYDRIGKPAQARPRGAGIKRTDNLPIVEVYGPSVPGIVVNKIIEQRVISQVQNKFPELLRREVAFASRK